MGESTKVAGPVKVVVIGAGNRGSIYAGYAKLSPEKMQVVGVVDRNELKRARMMRQYDIPPEHTFSSVEEFAEFPKYADAVVISTLDLTHKEIAVEMAKKKYHILLEKPMAVSLEDCKDISKAVEENGVILAVCHVMRYTPNYSEVMKVINSGKLGEVISVQHLEAVGNTHFSHSFVRGNWGVEKNSSFSLMTKSIHDVDLINMFMGGAKCTKVSSFGHLTHFKKAKKPKEAGDAMRCMDCEYEPKCAYSAKKIYLEPAKQGSKSWPLDALVHDINVETITKALEEGPYGRCVYECDNDVCDNQVVIFDFEGEKTASFSMIAFTEDLCIRKTKIYGSRGELISDGENLITVFDFETREKTVIHPFDLEEYKAFSDMFGHEGGDYGIISNFIDSIIHNNPKLNRSGAHESLLSHVYTFAAEMSRLENRTIFPQDLL
ncbi:hypothetical protein BB560_002594 [Smittium megazygosporum]|uniref:Gfo/Idh/MocA-like oxidoreductase N-terminal domain-containing protein n=1 Tax=Smittium megazygosporum TaxID=133381 RepID=A0A2T9ZEC8_9FUNG|nr:hypothetical protein BB560_002594 [Smittium megazygosporum]